MLKPLIILSSLVVMSLVSCSKADYSSPDKEPYQPK